jgi:ribosomal protein RSM22 (predicted rRNA methylase)
MPTFINLPETIQQSITHILSQPENTAWLSRTTQLHQKYTAGKKHPLESFVVDFTDIAAYLALRVPATYAQITGALLQIKQVMPEWQPTSVLDLGSGPGTGIWAAHQVWPGITTGNAKDEQLYFLTVGQQILQEAQIPVEVRWQQESLRSDFGSKNQKYDLVIISSLLNELEEPIRKKVLDRAFSQCSGMVVIVEPGTPQGYAVIASLYKQFDFPHFLIAPYIENTFVEPKDGWLHFPQRFIRPEFLRRVRQQMRESSLMASDWEEAKYSYIAIGKYQTQKPGWGRIVSPVKKQKAWFDLSILTAQGIQKLQVFKRDKDKYNFVKKLSWGELVKEKL